MRRPLYLANWKMNKTETEARHWVESAAGEAWEGACDVAVAPPFTALHVTLDSLREAAVSIDLAAQTCHWEGAGAFTGEISPHMLTQLSVRYVLAGHSERRQLFGETDDRVGRKVAAVVASGMIPVICIGETQSEREAGRTRLVIESQTRRALEGLDRPGPEEVVLAYEPVWAIGTGIVATTEQVAEAHALLRTLISAAAGPEKAARVRILYGGSVTPSTIGPIAAIPDVDGALVGGASLDAARFFDIVRRGTAARAGPVRDETTPPDG